MSKSFNKYIDDNLKNIFYNKEEISFQEYERLPKNEKDNLAFENNQYYRKIPFEVNKDDVHTGIMIEIHRQLYRLNKQQSKIKGMLTFFVVLTIIGLLFSLLNMLATY